MENGIDTRKLDHWKILLDMYQLSKIRETMCRLCKNNQFVFLYSIFNLVFKKSQCGVNNGIQVKIKICEIIKFAAFFAPFNVLSWIWNSDTFEQQKMW